jgi:hypothetical protein
VPIRVEEDWAAEIEGRSQELTQTNNKAIQKKKNEKNRLIKTDKTWGI